MLRSTKELQDDLTPPSYNLTGEKWRIVGRGDVWEAVLTNTVHRDRLRDLLETTIPGTTRVIHSVESYCTARQPASTKIALVLKEESHGNEAA